MERVDGDPFTQKILVFISVFITSPLLSSSRLFSLAIKVFDSLPVCVRCVRISVRVCVSPCPCLCMCTCVSVWLCLCACECPCASPCVYLPVYVRLVRVVRIPVRVRACVHSRVSVCVCMYVLNVSLCVCVFLTMCVACLCVNVRAVRLWACVRVSVCVAWARVSVYVFLCRMSGCPEHACVRAFL